MKKILFVNSVCSVGSTGRIVKDLYDAAVAEGHVCRIAYGRGSAQGVPESDTYCIGTKLSLYITALRSRFNDREGFMLKEQTRRFLRYVESFAPDIIHIHNIHGYFLNIPLFFEYIEKHPSIKVIWTLHDCWSFTGHCAVFDADPCEKWKTGCSRCPRKKTYPASLVIDNCARNYVEKKKYLNLPKNMTLVTPSEWLAGIVKESFLSKYPVEVIRNGIDTSFFAPTASDIRERYGISDKRLLLAVSLKWYPSKGIDDIVRLRKLLDDSYVIAVIGEGSESYFEGDGFITLSRTNDRNELAQWYTAADYLINPTHADNFPTVNLEALACGTPVVTYNTGGSPEAVDEGSGAVIYECSPESLAEYLCKEPDFVASDCIARSELFDKSNALKGYLGLYAES
jgi:glycosyltransferase involved in cell wall biosynthesis